MPLTAKGEEIKKNMEKEYGKKKGESVFYASANKGTITGVHNDRKDRNTSRDVEHPNPASGPMSTKGPSAGRSEGLPEAATPSSKPAHDNCAMNHDAIKSLGKRIGRY